MASKGLTFAEARRATNWFRGVMGLGDWQITLAIQNGPPEWAAEHCSSDNIGESWTRCAWKKADVWVSPERCKREIQSDPLAILFHELHHVVLYDVGLTHDAPTPDNQEFLLNRLGTVLAFAYRKGMKEK